MLNLKKPCRSLIKYGGSYGYFTLAIVSVLLITLRDFACLVTLANATNAVLSGGNIIEALLFMAAAMLARMPLNAFQEYARNKYYLTVTKKLKEGLALRLSQMPLSFIENQNSGTILSTYSTDTEIFLNWIFRDLFKLINTLFYFVCVFFYSLSQNVLLTAIIFPTILIIVPFFSGVYKKLEKVTQVQRNSAAQSLVKMQEVLSDPEFVKTYTLEEAMDKRLKHTLSERRSAEKRGGIYQGIITALGMLASYLPAFSAAVAGVYFLASGQISAGFLVGFVQIVIQRLGDTIVEVTGIFSDTKRAGVSAERIIALFNTPAEREDGDSVVSEQKCCFSFENVSFHYGNGKEVLKNISFRINTGERIAFVGRSGCGKTTVLKLMMGLYEATDGRITYFGKDIKETALRSLREQIAPVFQDSYIFPVSIRDNIGAVMPGAPDKDIWEAAEKAGLKKFIEELPEGLNTIIGEKGVTLSGGQRQRVTIARAFLSNCPILLFDEPTSALDAMTELIFQDTLDALSQGRTTIMVAHRLNTIRNCDKIFVLDNGGIVQCGTHEELIRKEGLYQSLYKEQLKGGLSHVS